MNISQPGVGPGSIVTSYLADGAVTSAKIAANTITQSNMGALSVGRPQAIPNEIVTRNDGRALLAQTASLAATDFIVTEGSPAYGVTAQTNLHNVSGGANSLSVSVQWMYQGKLLSYTMASSSSSAVGDTVASDMLMLVRDSGTPVKFYTTYSGGASDNYDFAIDLEGI